MSKLRVLQAVTGLGVGGAERVVLDLAQHLDRTRFSCELLSFAGDTSSFDIYGRPEVPHHLFNLKAARSTALLRFGDVVRLLRRLEPDIVHAHMFHALAIVLSAVRVASRRPRIVFTSHNAHIAPWRARIIRASRRYRHADIVFADRQHEELNADRTVVIPNGVFVSEVLSRRRARTNGEPIRFLAVGRLVPEKDPVGLIRSFARAGIPGATLALAGTGPLEAAVREEVKGLGLEGQVSLLGLRGDIRELMKSADVFVMHSLYEGLPLALLEAGAEALAVVATPVGAIPDVLGADRGYLTPRSEFHLAMREVANNPAEAFERAMNLYGAVKRRYSTSAMVAAHQDLYARIATDIA